MSRSGHALVTAVTYACFIQQSNGVFPLNTFKMFHTVPCRSHSDLIPIGISINSNPALTDTYEILSAWSNAGYSEQFLLTPYYMYSNPET